MNLNLLNSTSKEESCCCQKDNNKGWNNSINTLVLFLMLVFGHAVYAVAPTISAFAPATRAAGQTVSTGSELAVFSGDPRVAPSFTAGGVVRVTYTIAGSCNQDVVNATFTVKRVSNCGGGLTKVASPESASSAMDIKVYPNPFTGAFTFNLTTSSEATVVVSVYDMMGRLIENREVMPAEVNELQLGDRYSSGIYNVVVSQGAEVKTLRVIKR